MIILKSSNRTMDLRAAASASSSSSTSSSSASSSSSSSLAAPASSPSETYLQEQKTSVMVVRRMRRARSHWRGRCDGRSPMARRQASAHRMRPGLRGLRPQEAIWWIIGHDLLLLALGVAVLGKLDELLLLVLSLACATGRHCDMCGVWICGREWVSCVGKREEREEKERGRRDRGRERTRERESDTWLPGWASRCNTHTERLGGPLAHQRRAAHRWHGIAQGQQQRSSSLSSDARALVGR